MKGVVIIVILSYNLPAALSFHAGRRISELSDKEKAHYIQLKLNEARNKWISLINTHTLIPIKVTPSPSLFNKITRLFIK
jgi:hypothetical protein